MKRGRDCVPFLWSLVRHWVEICFLPLWPPAPCHICPFHSFDRLLPRQVQMVHTLIAGLQSAGEMCDAVMFFPCMLRRPHYSDCFLRRLNFQIRPNPHSEPMPTQETPESRASRRSAVRTISRLSSVLQSPDVLNKDCGAQILALRVQQLRQDSCIES